MIELDFQLSLMHLNYSTAMEEGKVVRDLDRQEESLKEMEQLASLIPS